MRVSQTILATEKQAPSDAELISHKLMIRAGLIRKVAAGIYSWLPTGLKVLQKVEKIVREEMNKSGASELWMPSVLPAELIKETDRWDKFGPELLKIRDRHKRDFCYGPTHEEVITDIARNQLNSYKQLPLNLYQIQTKFRDEIRPRYGIMRGREFIMKDAYSFHTSYECLGETYEVMYQTYCNILNAMGLKFRAVSADSGAIGGDKSHEFQVLADAGEDIICYCEESDYAANIELATYQKPDSASRQSSTESIQEINTPNQRTIKDICDFLKIDIKKTIKSLVVKTNKEAFLLLILRGDHELNEVKVEKLPEVAGGFEFASEEEIRSLFNADPGSLGPVASPIKVIVDHSATMCVDFACGANENDKHFTGVNWDVDIKDYSTADLRNVIEGDISPDGKGQLKFLHGIEIGHIFQLGTHYSEKMNATVLGESGKPVNLVMGCYGFGVTRAVAAAIEQSYDDNGIIWPKPIAPYDVALIPMNMHKSPEVKEAAENLYAELLHAGFDVYFDDRNERAGAMFADADLIGIPNRVVIGSRGLSTGMVEYKSRTDDTKLDVELNDITAFLKEKI
ncbi:proline--tRNA ligase [Francisellaceae bacterium]|nr:proline--tRNA ligase [Francisellaceae bacterium]